MLYRSNFGVFGGGFLCGGFLLGKAVSGENRFLDLGTELRGDGMRDIT